MSTPRIVTLDRIEGTRAVLLDGSTQVDVPIAWLPDGAREGMAYSVSFQPAPAAQAETGARVRALQDRLFKK